MDVPLWTVTRYIYFMLLLAVTMQQFEFHHKWKINLSLIVMLWKEKNAYVDIYHHSIHPSILRPELTMSSCKYQLKNQSIRLKGKLQSVCAFVAAKNKCAAFTLS